MTATGLQRLHATIRDLEIKLVTITRQKGEAAEVGGNVWHDNFSFEQLQRDEAMVLWRLNKARAVLAGARLVEAPARSRDVRLGSRLTVRFDDGRERAVTIGGSFDSDASAGIVSWESPLGRCLLGAQEGDERSFSAGGRERRVTVVRLLGQEDT